MKKIILLAFMVSLVLTSFSQTYPARPLFGTAPNQNNTGSSVTYNLVALGDTAGSTTDTVTIIPNNYTKYYSFTLKDSADLVIQSTNNSYTGSIMYVTIFNTSGSNHFLYFGGYSGLATQWIFPSGVSQKVTCNSGNTTIVAFLCTGVGWQELWTSKQ